MVRSSKQGMKKSPPASGRGRGSRKPKPTGVVPITKYFSRSPKSSSLVAEAAGSTSHSPAAQLSSPLKELPKPPLSDTSNQSVNGYTESTTGEKTSSQPLKVSPKKIRLGDVRVVLRKSPIKGENKKGMCSQAAAEHHQPKPQTETPRNNTIIISDSPAELGTSRLTAPEPKRPCLIDLTESPLIVVDMQQGSNTQLPADMVVCSESRDKGGMDTNERVKELLPSMNSTASSDNCTIKMALFTDCELQCTSTTQNNDLASITPASPSSQKNDEVEETSISKGATQTLSGLQVGEKAIQHAEDGISQPLNLSSTGEKLTRSFQPHTAGGKTIQTLNPPNDAGEMTAQPLNLTTDGEETLAREGGIQLLNLPTVGEKIAQPLNDAVTGGETSQPIDPPTTGKKATQLTPIIAGGEISQPVSGDIQPPVPLNLSVTLIETNGFSTQPDSYSPADSATVVIGDRATCKILDAALSDVELVLCQRGASYFQGESCAVKLFSITQDSVLDNLLDFNSRVQSDKLSSIVQYLRVATTAVAMPKAHSLAKLWELITDPITSSSARNFSVLDEIEGWFHQLLLLHPPGQHHTVDQQYAVFFDSLPGSATGAVFGLWEHVTDLLSGSEYCVKFLSLLVDLLLADYWAFLDSHRKTPPMFVRIFWQNCEQTHLTISLRKLLEVVTLLLLDYTGSRMESIKLGNLMALVYLASTRCTDLTTELLLIAQKLPIDKLLLFFSRVRPLSLSSHLAENVPRLKEMLIRFAGLFCPNKSGAARKLFKPSQINSTNSTTLSSPGQAICVDNEDVTMECTSTTQSQSQPSPNPQNLSGSGQEKQQGTCLIAGTSQPIEGAGLQVQLNSCENLQIERSSTTNLPSQEQGGRKKVTPSIMKTNSASKLFVVRGKDCTTVSRVTAQIVYNCENCRNGTCPRCVQARSIPIHNCKK